MIANHSVFGDGTHLNDFHSRNGLLKQVFKHLFCNQLLATLSSSITSLITLLFDNLRVI